VLFSSRQRYSRPLPMAIVRSFKHFLERDRNVFAALVVIGLVPRIVMMLGSTGILWMDSLTYYHSAYLLSRLGLIGHRLIYGGPIFPLFLSVFLSMGSDPSVGRLFVAAQHLFGIGATLFFFLGATRLVSRGQALAAAAIFSLDPI